MNTSFILLVFLVFIRGYNTEDENLNKSSTVKPLDPVIECIDETKVEHIQVARLRAGTLKKTSHALKEWVLCYLDKIGAMSKAGVLRQDFVLKDIPLKDKIKVEKIIDRCLYKKPHHPAEIAWHYLACFRDKNPKYFRKANYF